MGIIISEFGITSKGESARLYTLSNENGMEAAVSDFGAVLVKLLVAGQNGRRKDVVWGFDHVKPYEDNVPGFGAVIGRNANRIGGARFLLNGKTVELEKNDGNNNLHSGLRGYQRRMWDAEPGDPNSLEPSISFTLCSPDQDQGYPGEVQVSVTYTLTSDNALRLDYKAIPSQDTVINMTNHSYFNLDGQESSSVLDHAVWIKADAFTPADAQSIPTGEILKVDDTPMDFRLPKKIGEEINSDYEATVLGLGYDHNWVLDTDGTLTLAAKMRSESSGILMEVYTDLPGIQFYTANFLDGTIIGKNGRKYEKRSAACFETQFFPDTPNHDNFPTSICRAGETYQTSTIYKFKDS